MLQAVFSYRIVISLQIWKHASEKRPRFAFFLVSKGVSTRERNIHRDCLIQTGVLCLEQSKTLGCHARVCEQLSSPLYTTCRRSERPEPPERGKVSVFAEHKMTEKGKANGEQR